MDKKPKTSNLDRWLTRNVNRSANLPKQEANNAKKNGDKKPFFRLGSKSRKNTKHLKLLFLGGLNEIGGKNMMALEYGNDIIVIDMGLSFPEQDMLGVDYIAPDSSYLEQNVDKIRGVIITHGHLDHIGAINYIAPRLNNPDFYGTKLTMGFVKAVTSEYKVDKKIRCHEIKPRQLFQLGVFKIKLFRVNHSIPDAVGVIIETPDGLVVHTGDFKFDMTPADGIMADIDVMEALGKKKVTVMLSDSTNSGKAGKCISEKKVGESIDELVRDAKGRIVIATFSSLIGRMQQILDAAKKYDRKVFLSGRSMVRNFEVAEKLGFLKFPKGMVRELRRAKKQADAKNALILSTGSQGETMAALTRMAMNQHAQLKLHKNDTIVFSSSAIPGNEGALMAVMNELAKKGVNIITNKHMDVHTSGHGYAEELQMMLNLIKPKYFVPVHGQFYHRKTHGHLAEECGVKKENIFLLENGNILNVSNQTADVSKKMLSDNYTMVDNQTNTICDVSSHIVSERQAMSLNGAIVMHAVVDKKTKKLISMEVQSHGFIFMKQTKKVLNDLMEETKRSYNTQYKKRQIKDGASVEMLIKSIADRTVLNKLQRRPLIMPVVTMI
ncbi:ribonuclease J [bacterium]|jgi:ribonuclease J|nr:ribonuclease J [bacterium]